MPEATFDWRTTRLRKHADYQRVYQASRRHSSASMTYFFAHARSRRTGNRAAAAYWFNDGPRAGRRSGAESDPPAYERSGAAACGRTATGRRCGAASAKTVLDMDFAKLERRGFAHLCGVSDSGSTASDSRRERFPGIVARDGAGAAGILQTLLFLPRCMQCPARRERAGFNQHVLNMRRLPLRSMGCCGAR